jgi:transcriptional regulator with XRE-family HTH domain
MAKSIGALLRAYREDAGIPQVTLARRLRVSQQVVSRIESGVRPDPRFSTVARAAAVLGISLDILAAEAGFTPRSTATAEPRADAELDALERDLDRMRERITKLRARRSRQA